MADVNKSIESDVDVLVLKVTDNDEWGLDELGEEQRTANFGGKTELQATKLHLCEMEEELAKLKQKQSEIEKLKQLQTELGRGMSIARPPSSHANHVNPFIQNKMDVDNRSIFIGNVDYGATAELLKVHFHGCGAVNCVTIPNDKFSGNPKGFAYIEFADKDSVQVATALDKSLFKGRQIKVCANVRLRYVLMDVVNGSHRPIPSISYRPRQTVWCSPYQKTFAPKEG